MMSSVLNRPMVDSARALSYASATLPIEGAMPTCVRRSVRILGVARQNYYKHKRTPTTPRQLRREWLTGLIREVHVASRGAYGYRRVYAELTLGMGIQVCSRTVSVLMTQAGIGRPTSS